MLQCLLIGDIQLCHRLWQGLVQCRIKVLMGRDFSTRLAFIVDDVARAGMGDGLVWTSVLRAYGMLPGWPGQALA
ncbi:hypothetical protein D3C80_2160760 [compost metagenome]